MEMERRLEKLASYLKTERRKGFVKSWSVDLKKEIVFLVEQLGVEKVSEKTKFHKPTLYALRKKYRIQTPEENICRKKENIVVTRIVAGSIDNKDQEKIPVASIIKDKLEFKIYCKDTAEKLVERFFI